MVNQPNLRVRDVATGTRVTFQRITVTHQGREKIVGGFTGVATNNVMPLGDGRMVRQFNDIDPPDILFGSDSVWVVMEDDIAEDFFAAAASSGDEINGRPQLSLAGELTYHPSIDINSVDMIWLMDWMKENLGADDYISRTIFTLADWWVRYGDVNCDVVACRNGTIEDGNYFLLRMETEGLYIHVLPKDDWVMELENWWKRGSLPPAQAMHHVSRIMERDEFWTKIV